MGTKRGSLTRLADPFVAAARRRLSNRNRKISASMALLPYSVLRHLSPVGRGRFDLGPTVTSANRHHHHSTIHG
jgi:hypothetical protein